MTHEPWSMLSDVLRIASIDTLDSRFRSLQFESRKLKAGDVVFSAGERGDSMALLVDGTLDIELPDGTNALTSAFDVIGEVCCFDPGVRSATVTAATDVTLWEIRESSMEMLRAREPAKYCAFLRAVGERMARRIRLINKHIEERYGAATDVIAEVPHEPVELPRRPELLTSVPMFASYPLIELRRLATFMEFHRYQDGQIIDTDGGGDDPRVFFVLNGEVEIRKRFGSNNCLLAVADPGEVIGQLSLLDGAPRSASLVARGETTVASLSRATYELLLSLDWPMVVELQESCVRMTARQLRSANERLAQIPSFATRPNTAVRFVRGALEASITTAEELEEFESLNDCQASA